MSTRPDDLVSLVPGHEVTRRDALKLLATGVAALETGCLSRAGDEEIVPYVTESPEHRPGSIVRYASALTLDGFGNGVIVETHEGRPTKLDGNPAHPANLGGSLPWMQARILDLYDPQRVPDASLGSEPATWSEIRRLLHDLPRGELWLVMPPQSSPTLHALLERARERHDLHVVYDAPLDHRNAYRGHAMVFDRALEQQLDLSRAGVIAAFDADFMAAMPMSAAWARQAAIRRAPGRDTSRIWLCEPMSTPTGTFADERIAIPAGDVAAIAVCLLDELGRRGRNVPALQRAHVEAAWRRAGASKSWVVGLVGDLLRNRGGCAVIVGDRQPPIVHALARWIDHACESEATFAEPAILDPLGSETLADLVATRSRTGAVIAIDVDPVYTAPRALDVEAAVRAASWSLHVGTYRTATARACAAFMPLAHDLETWSDPRAWDGTLAIAQPAIRPRFEVASAIDVVAALALDPRDARDLVRHRLRDAGLDADAVWTKALRAGVVAETRSPELKATPTWSAACDAALAVALAVDSTSIEIVLARSHVHDGRFAANAWLQELPHPITKQTWGNAALMSEGMASHLGVGDEDVVRIGTQAGSVEAPVIVVAGAADRSVTLEVGYGQRAPAIADRIGSDAYGLRTYAALIERGTVFKAGGTQRVVRTQTTMTEHGRDVAPVITLTDLLRGREVTAHLRGDQPSLLPARARTGVQWGMSIDTSICTGCSACMVACQAENNIPTVGPDDVARGRHMNWIRVDRYVLDGGAVVNEPLPCQHCEDAPCEYVCPVGATTHDPEGLNEQVYNRCIGTRFCSNNCPYKVRRFNWFAYESTTTRALQYNPDVTVRSRGVMEKCTYCVQRIRRAEHEARVARRDLRPGEVVTACQQACPTNAIEFGQLGERDTRFARMRVDPRRFDLLFDLGTRPRTEYLAKVRNPKGGT